MQKLSQKTQGIVYVLIAAFGFSLMSMFIKLAGDLPSFEKAFFRNFVALIFITILMLRSRTSFRPERRNLPALFGRCFFGTLGLLCNFYAIGKLNLPDANMLNKLSPFFAMGKTAAGSCFTSRRFRASCACRSWRWIMRR